MTSSSARAVATRRRRRPSRVTDATSAAPGRATRTDRRQRTVVVSAPVAGPITAPILVKGHVAMRLRTTPLDAGNKAMLRPAFLGDQRRPYGPDAVVS